MIGISGTSNLFMTGIVAEINIIYSAPNECFGCSACCQFCGEPPFKSIKEIESLPEQLKDELFAHIHAIEYDHIPSRGSKNMPCMWLNIESGLCLHYEHRPKVCRDFVPSGSECLYFINKAARKP